MKRVLPELDRTVDLIDAIRAQHAPIEYMGAQLYTIDGESMAKLAAAAETLDLALAVDGRSRRMGFWAIGNLINPDKPAHLFKLFPKRQYVLVKDTQKVVPKLPKLLKIWENKMRKEANVAHGEYGYSEEEKARAAEALEERIRLAKETVFEIMAEPEKHEVWLSTVRRAKNYPFIYFKGDGSREARLLRSGVPNFLWLETAHEPEKTAAEKALDEMENIFGDIYVKTKEKR